MILFSQLTQKARISSQLTMSGVVAFTSGSKPNPGSSFVTSLLMRMT